MKKFITLSVLSTVFLGMTHYQVDASSNAAAASAPAPSSASARLSVFNLGSDLLSGRAQMGTIGKIPPITLIQACIEFAHNMREHPRLPANGQLTYNMLMQACKSIVAYDLHNSHQAYQEDMEAVATFFEEVETNTRLGFAEEAKRARVSGNKFEADIRSQLEHDPRQASGTFASYFEYASYALDMANGHGNPHNEERNKKAYSHNPKTWQWGYFSPNEIDGEFTRAHEYAYRASMDHTKELMQESLVKPVRR